MDEIETTIQSIIPNINANKLAEALQALEAAGVETKDDLAHVRYEDLVTVLNPIQIRKLLAQWTAKEIGKFLTR